MKPWEDYQTKKPIATTSQILNQLMKEIDETPLTKDQREEKVAFAKERAKAERELAMRVRSEDTAKLLDTFWADCWDDIGESHYMTEDVKSMVENKAWEDGHSDGLANVHNHMIDIVNFTNDVINGVLKTVNEQSAF